MQAMIFAAGLGTRLKPLTDHMPKAMVSVGGKPLIRHVIEKLKASDAERIVVNVHHFAEQITDYLKDNNNFGVDIRNIRLKQAAKLLLDPNRNVTDVMYACGFSNAASFSTMFKNLYGCSPREYMNKAQEENP